MEDKVKEWIEYEYKCAKIAALDRAATSNLLEKYSKNIVSNAIHRCYGVIMFAINNCFDEFNEDLGNWWDDEMLPRFRELERKVKNYE